MSDSNKLCLVFVATAKACARLQLSQAGQGGTGAESRHSHTWLSLGEGM